TQATSEEDLLNLMVDEEQQEKDLIRILLEHGDKDWDENSSVADYIFHSALNFDLIKNKTILEILSEYKTKFDQGEILNEKFFIYHINREISKLAVDLLYTPYEISHNWEDVFRITVPTKEDIYKQDVKSALSYLMLIIVLLSIHYNQK